MRIPWFRRNFLARRWLDRVFLDGPDFLARAFTKRGHWPPYSLRSFVGGADGFDQVGLWFLGEFRRLGLLAAGTNILDIGCGCGRLAFALATDDALRDLGISYVGMDVDRAVIEWCQKNISPRNTRFTFYHADCYNASYNPGGTVAVKDYRFPLPDASFQLILLSSVFTHVLEAELRRYLQEVFRLLKPGGVAYATFFLFENLLEPAAGAARHGITFPFVRGHYAVSREDFPTNAVAYEEPFVRDLVRQSGLEVIEPSWYGTQDLLLLRRPN